MRITMLLVGLLSALGCSSSNAIVATDRPTADAPEDARQDAAPDAALDAPNDAPLDRTEPRDLASDQGIDAPVDRPAATDVPADLAPEASRDVVEDRVGDVAPDATSDGPTACSAERPCRPFICSCGRCDPSHIVCVSDARGCPLACLSSCPELATAVCPCAGGVCGAPVLMTDAGASTDAGLPSGAECDTSDQCTSGLLCCYPCGIPGCHNRCTTPMGGRCPLIP